MGQSLQKDPVSGTSNVFLNVMLEKLYDPVKLEMQLKYMDWKPDDTYYITLIRFTEQDAKENQGRQMNSLMRMLIQNLTDASIYVWQEPVSQDWAVCISLWNTVEEPGQIMDLVTVDGWQ